MTDFGSEEDIFSAARVIANGNRAVLFAYDRMSKSWEEVDKLLDCKMQRDTKDPKIYRYTGISERLQESEREGLTDVEAVWVLELKGCQDCD